MRYYKRNELIFLSIHLLLVKQLLQPKFGFNPSNNFKISDLDLMLRAVVVEFLIDKIY